MATLSPLEIGKQLRKPEGENGIVIGNDMNRSNSRMYNDLFSLLTTNDHDTILEIGYGNGIHFPEYFTSGKNIMLSGMDYSEVMYQEVLKNNKTLINAGKVFPEHGDIKDHTYPSDRFDHIIALNTVYFWEPLDEYLQVLYHILKPGGKLYIGYRPKRVLSDIDFVQEGFSLYDEDVLNERLRKAGFDIIQEHQNNYTKLTVNGKSLNSADLITICIKKEAF